MIARLAPGATIEQARADVAAITRKAHLDHPDAYDAGSDYRVTLTPFLRDALGENARLTLWLLMGAAAFVLGDRVRQRREPDADARGAARARA